MDREYTVDERDEPGQTHFGVTQKDGKDHFVDAPPYREGHSRVFSSGQWFYRALPADSPLIPVKES